MKKITLTFIKIIGIVSISQGQPITGCNTVFDDFSAATSWNHPVLSTALCNPGNFNTLNIASGTFIFQQSRDQYLNYFYKTGLAISNTDFKAKIDLQHSVNGWGVGHVVLGLTDDTEPFFSSTSSPSTSALINSVHNGIAVMFQANSASMPTDFYFEVVVNVGGTSTVAGFPIHLGADPVGTNNDYYLELLRMSGSTGLLNVYSDMARTINIGSSGLFTIPAAIVNLNTVQFGTDANQNPNKMYTGKLDNLCIDNSPLITNTSPNVCGAATDDFTNPSIWGHPILAMPLGCFYNGATMFVGSGLFNFAQSRDNNFNFMNRVIPTVSNSTFTANIDFHHVSNGSTAGGAGHILLALNDGYEPFRSSTASVGSPGNACGGGGGANLVLSPNTQKGIAVSFESDVPNAPTNFSFKVYTNDGAAITMASTPIVVPPFSVGGVSFNDYYISLERTSSTAGRLTVFSSPLRTLGTVIGTSTYIIPPSIINLDVAQIGTNE